MDLTCFSPQPRADLEILLWTLVLDTLRCCFYLDVYIGRFHLDTYFWNSDLDVQTPGTSSIRDPDAYCFLIFCILKPLSL